MVVPAFFVTLAGVLLLLVVFQGAKKAGMERARRRLEHELQAFLRDASAASAERGTGTYEGMATAIAVRHHDIGFELCLPTAVVPYRELLERFGSADLKGRLYAAGVEVGSDDRVRGVVPREEGLGENLGAIANRLPLAGEIWALRARAPGALVARLERVQAAREIDEILLALTAHFPGAPETQQAIDVAAHREHGGGERVRERAERWLAAHG